MTGKKTERMKVWFLLFMGNFLSHGYLILLTGTFWDDWLYYYHDTDRVWEHFIQSGRPSLAYIPAAFWNLPGYGYRWVIFGCCFITSIFVYLILRNIPFFEKNLKNTGCLAVSLFYTVMPVNDARVCMVDMPFTISLLMFFAGWYVFIRYRSQTANVRNFRLRIAAEVLFFCSFITNSMLVFYFLPLFFIFYEEICAKRNLKKAAVKMLKQADFFMLPFIFYAGKQFFFPAYGIYEGYNAVTLSGMVHAVKLLTKAVCLAVKNVYIEFFYPFISLAKIAALILLTIWITGCLVLRKTGKKTDCSFFHRGGVFYNIAAMGIGILMTAFGLFPYIVVSQSEYISITGVYGRYSLLLPIGMALFFFSGIRIVCKYNWTRFVVCAVFLVLGSIACNCHYLNYQIDAYYQEALINKLSDNEYLKEKKNLLLLSSSLPVTGSTRFYTLNGDASVAYGSQTRLIMNGYGDLQMLEKDLNYLAQSDYLMNDYDASYKKLDGIIVFDFDIQYHECLKLRWMEYADKSAFQKYIDSKAEFSYYPADSRKAALLIESGYE